MAPTLPDSGIGDGFEGGSAGGGTTQSGVDGTSQSGGAIQEEDGVEVSMSFGENETDDGSFFGGIGGNGDNSVTDEVTVPIKQPVVS